MVSAVVGTGRWLLVVGVLLGTVAACGNGGDKVVAAQPHAAPAHIRDRVRPPSCPRAGRFAW